MISYNIVAIFNFSMVISFISDSKLCIWSVQFLTKIYKLSINCQGINDFKFLIIGHSSSMVNIMHNSGNWTNHHRNLLIRRTHSFLHLYYCLNQHLERAVGVRVEGCDAQVCTSHLEFPIHVQLGKDAQMLYNATGSMWGSWFFLSADSRSHHLVGGGWCFFSRVCAI